MFADEFSLVLGLCCFFGDGRGVPGDIARRGAYVSGTTASARIDLMVVCQQIMSIRTGGKPTLSGWIAGSRPRVGEKSSGPSAGRASRDREDCLILPIPPLPEDCCAR